MSETLNCTCTCPAGQPHQQYCPVQLEATVEQLRKEHTKLRSACLVATAALGPVLAALDAAEAKGGE